MRGDRRGQVEPDKAVHAPTPSTGPTTDDAVLDLRCQNWPTDRQTRKARRFGEGFTWTCPTQGCGRVFVLTQGKGDYWYWAQVT